MADRVAEIPLDDALARALDCQRTVNRVHLTGVVAVSPVLRSIGQSGTPSTTMTLVTAEYFARKSSGARGHHFNLHEVQVLGKDAQRAAEIRLGHWVSVDGYQRTDGGRAVVRVYTINSWEEGEPIPQEAGPAAGVEAIPGQGSTRRRP